MTVSELITELQKQNPNSTMVCVGVGEPDREILGVDNEEEGLVFLYLKV